MSKPRQRFKESLTFFGRNLIIMSLLFLSVGSRAEGVVYGPQFRTAALGAVDMLSSQLTLMQAQAQYNKVLINGSVTHGYAPANIFLNDGTIAKGTFTRTMVLVGGGYGKISKIGVFGGFQSDWVTEKTTSQAPNQGGYFIGVAALGFQITRGYIDENGVKLDGNYDFTTDPIQQAWDNSGKDNYGLTIYSIYHKYGIYAAAIFGERLVQKELYEEMEAYMSETRVNIQPLKSILSDAFGLPFVDVSRQESPYSYSSDIKDYYDAASRELKTRYNLQLGSDDLFGMNIRSSLAMQVSPEVSFRKFELAYLRFSEKRNGIFGARTQLFHNDGKVNVGFDSFVMLSMVKKYVNLSFSYAYNSPQSLTFIPLEDLHVFGVQLILGRRETAKAIIPFAATAFDEESINDK